MQGTRGGKFRSAVRIILSVALLPAARVPVLTAQSSAVKTWRAGHHMHLASPGLCRRVGECLESNHPPAVFAADAIRALDGANVMKGVVLSCAYLYGLPSLHLSPGE